MEQAVLDGKKREVIGKKVKLLRKAGQLPGVVYARDMEPLPVQVDSRLFEKIIRGPQGRNVLINLKLAGADTLSVITHAIDWDPLNGKLRHVDFHKISMSEKIKAKVHVEFVGVPTGVKDEGGVLVHSMRELEVRCLPNEIPDKFTVDITALKIGDSIHVSELPIPAGIELLSGLNEIVVTISAPTKDEEPVAAVVPVEGEAAAAVPGAEGGVATASKTAAPAAGAKGAAPAAAGAKGAAPAAGAKGAAPADAGKKGADKKSEGKKG